MSSHQHDECPCISCKDPTGLTFVVLKKGYIESGDIETGPCLEQDYTEVHRGTWDECAALMISMYNLGVDIEEYEFTELEQDSFGLIEASDDRCECYNGCGECCQYPSDFI